MRTKKQVSDRSCDLILSFHVQGFLWENSPTVLSMGELNFLTLIPWLQLSLSWWHFILTALGSSCTSSHHAQSCLIWDVMSLLVATPTFECSTKPQPRVYMLLGYGLPHVWCFRINSPLMNAR